MRDARGRRRRRPRRRASLAGALLGAINASCHRRPAHHALPGHAGDALRRPRPRHRHHRVAAFDFDRPSCAPSAGLARPGVPMPIVVFALVVGVAHVVLTPHPFGRQVYAVGNDPEAARKAGIRVDRDPSSRSTSSRGACAGARRLHAHRPDRPARTRLRRGPEFDVITAAVLGGASLFGGIGCAFGAVVGSTLIQTVQVGHGLHRGQPLPPADRDGRHHLPRRPLRQPARPPPHQLKRRTIRPIEA